MDSYQAIYDAARSRIGSVDTRDAIERAASEAFDMGNARALLIEQICMVGNEMSRPSAIYRPALLQDGDKWCALFGENLQEGVAGFGDTPDEAMRAFDQAWLTEKTPAAMRAERAQAAS